MNLCNSLLLLQMYVCISRPLTLTLDQKCNIAARELEGLREEIGQEEEEAESSYDNLRVSSSLCCFTGVSMCGAISTHTILRLWCSKHIYIQCYYMFPSFLLLVISTLGQYCCVQWCIFTIPVAFQQ